MNEVKHLQSINIDSLLDSNISENSENFLLFLQAYYEWLETTEIEIINSSGNFSINERIIGSTSKAFGIVKQVTDDKLIILAKSRTTFKTNEDITGQISNQTATIVSIKDNVIRASGNITDYRTVEKSIDNYVDYLKNELFQSIPVEYFDNKSLVASKFRDFFRSKGTEQSYRFFFKLIYNESIEFYYPGTDILRVSDGKYENPEIVRAVVTPRIFEFFGKTIRGVTEDDLANVVDIQVFFIGGIEIAEMTLKFVSGSFAGGSTITTLEDPTLTTTLYGIISDVQIETGGSGYNVGDSVIISGDGFEAEAVVSSISSSSIFELLITNITDFGLGIGYRIGTQASVDNTGTNGFGLVVRVTNIENPYTVTDTVNAISYTVGNIKTLSIINPGVGYEKPPVVTIEDTTIKNLGLLSEQLITIDSPGNLFVVGEQLIFTGGSGSGANGIIAGVDEIFANREISDLSANLISEFSSTPLNEPYEKNDILLEDDSIIIIDGGSSPLDVLKLEEWVGFGPISRIELSDFGFGYTNESLPTISVATANGFSSQLTVRAVQGTGTIVNVQTGTVSNIGTIRKINVTNFGINYTTATVSAAAAGDGNAILTPIISGKARRSGNWINDDGKINFKVLQDSFFYQDFSYVIRSGIPFNVYAETLKSLIHPAGLQQFGEITITSFINESQEFIASINRIVIDIQIFFDIGVVDMISEIFNKYKLEVSNEINVYFSQFGESKIEEFSANLISEFASNALNDIFNFEIRDITDRVYSFFITNLISYEPDIQTKNYKIATVDNLDESNALIVFKDTTILVENDIRLQTVSDRLISELSANLISEFADVPLNTPFDINNIENVTNKYKQIQGTVSYVSNSGIALETTLISLLEDLNIRTLQDLTFNDDLPIVSGNGTIFEVDYLVDDAFVANNEYFVVDYLLSNTSMIIDRSPENVFTDVIAYKQIA